jgi:hypothetical protein
MNKSCMVICVSFTWGEMPRTNERFVYVKFKKVLKTFPKVLCHLKFLSIEYGVLVTLHIYEHLVWPVFLILVVLIGV